MTKPTLPKQRDITCRCGTVNRYRTVCLNCSADLPNQPVKGPDNETQLEDSSRVPPDIPVDCLHRRPRQDAGFLSLAKYFVYAFAGLIAFFGVLNLVNDPEPPRITYAADTPTPHCPIKHACGDL